MQQAEEPSRVANGPERSGLKPTATFLVLLVVLGAIGGLALLTRPDPAPTPTQSDSAPAPNFALTDEEAIARFEELNQLLIAAYRNRDVSLLDEFITHQSPLRTRASNEIGQLIRDNVVPNPVFETKSLRVLDNDATEVVIRQVVIDLSRFESEEGKDITDDPKDILRVVEWTLGLEGSTWKIADSNPLRSRVLK